MLRFSELHIAFPHHIKYLLHYVILGLSCVAMLPLAYTTALPFFLESQKSRLSVIAPRNKVSALVHLTPIDLL